MGGTSLEVIEDRMIRMHDDIKEISSSSKNFEGFAKAQIEINKHYKEKSEETKKDLNTHKQNTEKKWLWVLRLSFMGILTFFGMILTAIGLFIK